MKQEYANLETAQLFIAKSGRLQQRLRIALLAATLAALSPWPHALAASAVQSQQQFYRIAAGPLSQSLNLFAAQAGVTLAFEPDAARGKQAAALHGQYSVEEGFAALLQETGLAAEKQAAGVYLLRGQERLEAQNLESIRVFGKQDDLAVVMAGSKVPLTLREVPQTVNVIGQERIEAQNLYTLEQAMKQASGVTVQRIDANRMTFLSRGFEMTSLSLDGTPTTRDNRIFLSPELAMYERVEVLKGPAGILNGAGGAGGNINLVRKRPQAKAAVSGELSAGSWNDYRGMIDATGSLTDGDNLRGRIVASKQDRQFHYAGGDEQSNLFYGVLEADLSPDTLLALGVSHQAVDARGAQRSLPSFLSITPGGDFKLELVDVSRGNFYGANWNRDYFWSDSVFAELEQQLGNGWLAKLSLRHAQNNFDLTQAYTRNGFGIDPKTGLVDINAIRFDYREQQNDLDAYVDGPFNLFGREHNVLVGVNYSRSEFSNKGNFNSAFLEEVDLYNPQVSSAQPDFVPVEDVFSDTIQRGIYSNLRLNLAEPLTLVLGGRLSWWDFSNTTFTPAGVSTGKTNDNVAGEFTPFAGLVYDIDQTYSLYASYAEVFQPHDARTRDSSGGMLKPLQGEQWETGIKGEYLDGALVTSLALFQVEEENRAMDDLNNANASIAGGKARSRGFEAEINGQLTADWSLSANYTYTHKDYLNSTDTIKIFSPKHIVRVWTRYQLPGELQGWHLQAGMQGFSKTYNTITPLGGAKLEQGGYALFDVGAGYRITPQWSADLLVTNLTDKKHYQRINTMQDGNIWGTPRSVTLTLRSRF